jgi:hypothetical protein
MIMNILESIYNEPEKWHISLCRFVHEDGASIWVGNGLLFCNIEPSGGFGFVMKIKVWRAYKWWLYNAPVFNLRAR